jgi:DNA-binding NtrC family response regulator
MSERPAHVCFVTKDQGLGDAVGRTLGENYVVRISFDQDFDGLNVFDSWPDVILLDLRADSAPAGRSAHQANEISRMASYAPVVVLCESDNRALIHDCIERGAYDTLASPPDIAELRLTLNRAHKTHVAEEELKRLRVSAPSGGRLHELLGTSPPMQELFAQVRKIAACDVNVLITGETGTGKELLARALHHLSARSTAPLVAFSCVNLPETLIEDELFGHEKGAFTGALMPRRGRLEAADRGTLFLDEIGDLSQGLQPKLLRVLQERTFERLGSNNSVAVDIRLISATNRSLAGMVQQGKFREDLFYRLNVVQLNIPPLRDRPEDIPLLAHHFLLQSAQHLKKRVRRFSNVALRALEEYKWPGNVRELQNVVQRAMVFADGPAIGVEQLPAEISKSHKDIGEGCNCERVERGLSYEEEVRQFRRRLVLRTLREYGWQKSESARALGIARGYLHRLINQLNIPQPAGVPECPEEEETDVPVAKAS